MPKTPNAAALTKIGTALGTEPLFIIEVDWDGSTTQYADKDFLGIRGKILNVSSLDTVAKLGSSGASGSLSVTLSDLDGSIKTIWNTTDTHKRQARVYQAFEGLAESDKFLLFSGEVSSPIDWDEGARTISFDIVSVIEDKQLGYSPEEGEFDFISDDAIGVPWPLGFGNVVRVPAAKITDGVRGRTLSHYGQITIPELEQLCALAVSNQQADTAKLIADGTPGYTDTNYAIVIDNVTLSQIALDSYLSGLVYDSPTQEDDLNSYIDVCKELERWRVYFDQEFETYRDAEARRLPLESTSGKAAEEGFKYFSAEVKENSNSTIDPTFSFGEAEKQGYRVKVSIPKYGITYRAAVPLTTGAVEAAQIAWGEYVAAYWPYTTSEQWAIDAALQATLSSLTVQLNDAVSDSGIALANMNLANINIASKNLEKDALEDDLLQFVVTTIIIEGGEKFEQTPTVVEIIINGLHYKGTFTGRTFTVDTANTPADVSVAISKASKTNQFILNDTSIELKGKYCLFNQWGITFVEEQDAGVCTISPILYFEDGSISSGSLSHPIYNQRFLEATINKTSVFMSVQWMDLIRSLGQPDYATGLSNLKQRDYGFDIGDAVYIAGDYKEIYIANLIPSTTVYEVMGWRTVDGVRQLYPIPSRYYVVNLNESIAGQNATTIRFRRPLTEYYGEDWENQIYVSLTSSVGPNTVDIVEHLVDTYTDLTKDTASFASVNTALDPFPSNFAFLDRRSTLGAIEDIAWQARCVAYIKDQTIFLKYLAVEESAEETFTESNIDLQSLTLTLTPTEDIITEFTAEWDSDYSAEKRNKVILRNNIGKYGTIQEDYDFYIYNVQELVLKAATFWLIRYSNTWKIAKFTSPLTLLRLDMYDTVALNFIQDWIASASVKGVVDNVSYNSDTFELTFAIRSAVRAGELIPYTFVWPASVAVDVEYPTPTDLYSGGATS